MLLYTHTHKQTHNLIHRTQRLNVHSSVRVIVMLLLKVVPLSSSYLCGGSCTVSSLSYTFSHFRVVLTTQPPNKSNRNKKSIIQITQTWWCGLLLLLLFVQYCFLCWIYYVVCLVCSRRIASKNNRMAKGMGMDFFSLNLIRQTRSFFK